MEVKNAFAKALKQIRLNKGMTQEDFSNISSRNYISALERAIKSPTLDKIESLANVLKIEPLTLLTLTYIIKRSDVEAVSLLEIVNNEIKGLKNL